MFFQILAWCQILKTNFNLKVQFFIFSQKKVSAGNYFVADYQSWSVLFFFIKCYETVYNLKCYSIVSLTDLWLIIKYPSCLDIHWTANHKWVGYILPGYTMTIACLDTASQYREPSTDLLSKLYCFMSAK